MAQTRSAASPTPARVVSFMAERPDRHQLLPTYEDNHLKQFEPIVAHPQLTADADGEVSLRITFVSSSKK